jgi:hypothetical protein
LTGLRDSAGGQRLDEAEETTRHSLQLFDRVQNEAGRASALTGLGEIAALRGEAAGRSGAADAGARQARWLINAAQLFEQSRNSYAQLGNGPRQANVLRILAIVHHKLGRPRDAVTELVDCIDQFRKLGDDTGLARALLNLSQTQYETDGASDDVLAAAEEAYDLMEQRQDAYWQGRTAMHLGRLLLKNPSRHAEALDLLSVAEDRFRRVGHADLVAECAGLLAAGP